MAGLPSSDRLAQLFISSMDPSGGGNFDDAAIGRAIETLEQMLGSQDAAAQLGSSGALEGTMVLIGMSLEEKPNPQLHVAAVRLYERALERVGPNPKGPAAGWARCVLLQQLAKCTLVQKRLLEAEKWGKECVDNAQELKGHPRDVELFGGAFSTQQTAREFKSSVFKLLARVKHEQGDHKQVRAYLLASGVEPEKLGMTPAPAPGEEEGAPGGGYPGAGEGSSSGASLPSSANRNQQAAVVLDPDALLWRQAPADRLHLKEYGFVDDGDKGTVTLIVNLKQHVGPEAVEKVLGTKQCKVSCTKESCVLKLRWWEGGEAEAGEKRVVERVLVLDPLAAEIIPEDTVTKLKGAESKRRVEVMLFKREKKTRWYGDIIDQHRKKTLPQESELGGAGDGKTKSSAGGGAQKEKMPTQWEPLSAEELAKLPTPGGTLGTENRPRPAANATSNPQATTGRDSSAAGVKAAPPAAAVETTTRTTITTTTTVEETTRSTTTKTTATTTAEKSQNSESPPSTGKDKPFEATENPTATPHNIAASSSNNSSSGSKKEESTMPFWVEEVSVRDEGVLATVVEVLVVKGGPVLGFGDLDLSITPESIRVELQAEAAERSREQEGTPEGQTLVIPLKSKIDVDAAEAKWKKKLGRLELRLPRAESS